MRETLILQGWIHDPSEGFIALLGGLWHREVDGVREIGLLAQPEHANRNGTVHGGMLMSFVDRAFGMTARLAAGAPRGATVSLNNQFLAPMHPGQFAWIAPRVVRMTLRLAFIEGTVICDDEPLVMSQGVWRIARRAD